MATNILAAMNDVAKLAKLTADANLENAQRDLDLTAKKELIAIAAALNTAANKGVNELVYNLSSAITRLTDLNLAYALNLIEADMTAAGYTYTQILNNRSGAVAGYNIAWEYVEPTDPVDPVDPNEGQDPNQNEHTDDSGSGTDNPSEGGNTDTTPEYTYAAVTEDQLVENAEGNPHELGWYEADTENEGQYVLTEDTTVDETKTYYIRSEVTE